MTPTDDLATAAADMALADRSDMARIVAGIRNGQAAEGRLRLAAWFNTAALVIVEADELEHQTVRSIDDPSVALLNDHEPDPKARAAEARAAAVSLPRDERDACIELAATWRDQAVIDGAHRIAGWWNACAALLADVRDADGVALRDFQDRIGPEPLEPN